MPYHRLIDALTPDLITTEQAAERWNCGRTTAYKRLYSLKAQPYRLRNHRRFYWSSAEIDWSWEPNPALYCSSIKPHEIVHNLNPWPMDPHPGMGWNNGWSMYMPSRPSTRLEQPE